MIVTTSMLLQTYKDYANPIDKIKRDCDRGILIRINRGIYETDFSVNPLFLSEVILSPSYISFEYALSFYGMIPERVFPITSASLNVKKNRTYINKFGRYEFRDVHSNLFSEGLTCVEDGIYVAKIATKEKALCDSLSKWRVVHSVKALKELMFEDKRIDKDEFLLCDFSLMERLALLYKKTNLEFLIKLIRKEYKNE